MKFELTEEEMRILRTGTLIERIRVYRNAMGCGLKEAKDACEKIMYGGVRIEDFFTPKKPCGHCAGTGFMKSSVGESGGACCKTDVHAQIEYPKRWFGPVESLVGIDVRRLEDRKMLHTMLDEWLDQERGEAETPDHFTVFRKFPKS